MSMLGKRVIGSFEAHQAKHHQHEEQQDRRDWIADRPGREIPVHGLIAPVFSARTGVTMSPSATKVPARDTTSSPFCQAGHDLDHAGGAGAERHRNGLDLAVLDGLEERIGTFVDHGGSRHGDAFAPKQLDLAAGEIAGPRGRAGLKRDADSTQPGRMVDLRRYPADGTRECRYRRRPSRPAPPCPSQGAARTFRRHSPPTRIRRPSQSGTAARRRP